MNDITKRILQKIGCPGLLEKLAALSPSDLNSLLLEVADGQAARLRPEALVKGYAANRFAAPSNLDAVAFYAFLADTLSLARRQGIQPVLLSPAAPLGSCSAVAQVKQKTILSAARGTEVLADPTNMLALHIAEKLKSGEWSNAEPLHLCAACRVTRAQAFSGPGFFAHFGLFGMVSSGRAESSYTCESAMLTKQLEFYHEFLQNQLQSRLSVVLSPRRGYTDTDGLLQKLRASIAHSLPDAPITVDDSKVDNPYYEGLNFKIFMRSGGEDVEIGDGGFVNWMQQMLGAKRERALISGIGLDRLILYR